MCSFSTLSRFLLQDHDPILHFEAEVKAEELLAIPTVSIRIKIHSPLGIFLRYPLPAAFALAT